MREAWRWFGPTDPVSLSDIRQTGATDIVSALHTVPIGQTWSRHAIAQHRELIERGNKEGSKLSWTVVESIPVHEDIKLCAPGHEVYVDNWIATLQNLAAEGISTICYNFMPVIDWTRTDLRYALPNGVYALRFDQDRFAVFDLFVLKRSGAADDYSEAEIERARDIYEGMDEPEIAALTQTIIAGLPGKMTDAYSLDDFRDALARYADVDHNTLRANLSAFLARVLPVAEELDVKLAIHPDDPPWDMFGLPRVICKPDDLDTLFELQPSPANGITLCVGTYGSRPDNDLPQMANDYCDRIFFAHLRGVTRDPNEQRSFVEASHLESDIDMVSVIANLLENERATQREIFIRPDHGHLMMDDIKRTSNPGYSAIGRMKGLAEIRGVIKAISANPRS